MKIKKNYRSVIPAICQVGPTVYGGTMYYDPLSTMGYRFHYIDRAGKIHRCKEKFTVVATA
jgi:hypothetical protein